MKDLAGVPVFCGSHDTWAGVVGLGALTGHRLLVAAYRWGRASDLAPLGYLTLVWSFLVGTILFGDRPAGAYEWSLAAIPDQAWRYYVFVLAPSLQPCFVSARPLVRRLAPRCLRHCRPGHWPRHHRAWRVAAGAAGPDL